MKHKKLLSSWLLLLSYSFALKKIKLANKFDCPYLLFPFIPLLWERKNNIFSAHALSFVFSNHSSFYICHFVSSRRKEISSLYFRKGSYLPIYYWNFKKREISFWGSFLVKLICMVGNDWFSRPEEEYTIRLYVYGLFFGGNFPNFQCSSPLKHLIYLSWNGVQALFFQFLASTLQPDRILLHRVWSQGEIISNGTSPSF